MMPESKFIDVEKVIRDKNPALLRRMPGFLLRYIKNKLHQEELNTIINDRSHLRDGEFCTSIIEKFNITVEVFGKENIPSKGGCILAANHPIGGMDAMALSQEISKIRSDYKFVVNDVLLNITNLKNIFVGVNKYGKNSHESLKIIGDLYASEMAAIVFPAGLVSRKQKGRIEDLEWKKTFITRAKKEMKPIIPIYIEGNLSNFFYNLSRWRTLLGIKANVELFFLADEQFKFVGKTIRITAGTPISPTMFDKSKTDYEWAQWVKSTVYNLK